ncbi:MAG: restriction endonuclease subunit S [Polyangiaceae bacterium]|jgi:type I restriction enzyme S subunit
MTPDGWSNSQVRDLLCAISTGVSVNSESRARVVGEVGVLKTSAVTYGVFRPEENKVVVAKDLHRVRENPKAGCVLLSRMNTLALVGASAYVERDWPDLVLPDRIWQLLPNLSLTDGRWLFHFLSAPDTRLVLSDLASGTSGSMKNLAQEKFLAMRLLLPPVGEQKKIAAILSSIDDTIEATQAVIDQLHVVKKAMMAELLTRGLPGRHTRFKQTEIGEVPDQWEVVRLGTVATVGNGSTPSKQRPDYWQNGSIPWLPTGKVNDRVIFHADEFVTETALAECPIRLLPKGTLLIAMIGQGRTRGKVAYLALEATINQNFAYVRPSAQLASWFLFAYLDHKYEHLRSGGRGSNQDALNCQIIKQYPVPLPDLDEQLEIAEAIRCVEERIEAEAVTASALANLKSALMSVLLTGEVRVKPDEAAA